MSPRLSEVMYLTLEPLEGQNVRRSGRPGPPLRCALPLRVGRWRWRWLHRTMIHV